MNHLISLNNRYLILASLVLLLSLITLTLASILTPHKHSAKFRIVPEYERTLETVVLSLSHREVSLERHNAVLSRFPDYAQTLLLVPSDNVPLIEDEILKLSYGDRISICPYDPKPMKESSVYMVFPDQDKLQLADTSDNAGMYHCGTIWAQDLFEPVLDDHGKIVLFAAELYKYYFKAKGADAESSAGIKVSRDNEFLEVLNGAHLSVQGLPLVFKGGNILFDQKDGRRIAFCGSSTIRTTRSVLAALNGKQAFDAQIRETIKRQFFADTLVVLGANDGQPESLYHIDQAMVLLKDGVVGIERIIDKHEAVPEDRAEISEVAAFLEDVRAAMVRLGYETFDINVTSKNVVNVQHYANSIPYVDRDTGQKTVMMPVYESAKSKVDMEAIEKNVAQFNSHGYEVVLVPTALDELRGGIHCLVNVVR